jgi:hypothetical protein
VLYDGPAGGGGVVLLANDSTYTAVAAGYPSALGGWAGAGETAGKGGVATGIYGYTDNGGGYGVVGVNSGSVDGAGAGVAGLNYSTAGEAFAVYGEIPNTSPGGLSAAVRGNNKGTTGSGVGVWGSHDGTGYGMYATADGGIGLVASGGAGTGVSAGGDTGVVATGQTTGLNAEGGTVGIAARAPIAMSATGIGTDGVAVSATATSSGPALEASNGGSGPAVLASHPGGVALQVKGIVEFNRSGVTTIRAGRSSIAVKFNNVSPSSIVLATLQQAVNGVHVAGIVAGTGQFTIVLDRAAPSAVKVGWFVIG